jgi:hypothetical protein
MSELSLPQIFTLTIDYESNVLAANIDSETGEVRARLGDYLETTGSHKITKAVERRIDTYNSQIVIEITNDGDPIRTQEEIDLIELDFSAYLNRDVLEKSARTAEIRFALASSDACLSFVSGNPSTVQFEEQCLENLLPIVFTEDFYLEEIRPNPADTDATINFGLAFDCSVKISLYDASGKLVATPVHETLGKGEHIRTLPLDKIPAGSYFIEMKAGPFKEVRRFVRK